MRKIAQDESLQMVHIEIIQYLSICNRYSNTTQSISEYLGQTKGSISQSLSILEGMQLVKRTQDKNDKRVFHLALTTKGEILSRRLKINFEGDLPNSDKFMDLFMELLSALQKKNNLKSFGQCSTCKFNESLVGGKVRCGLTLENLSKEDINKICREHKLAHPA